MQEVCAEQAAEDPSDEDDEENADTNALEEDEEEEGEGENEEEDEEEKEQGEEEDEEEKEQGEEEDEEEEKGEEGEEEEEDEAEQEDQRNPKKRSKVAERVTAAKKLTKIEELMAQCEFGQFPVTVELQDATRKVVEAALHQCELLQPELNQSPHSLPEQDAHATGKLTGMTRPRDELASMAIASETAVFRSWANLLQM